MQMEASAFKRALLVEMKGGARSTCLSRASLTHQAIQGIHPSSFVLH